LPPELLVLAQVCTKSFVGWGFAPDVTGGAYSSPPDPLLVYEVGPPVKGKEGGEGKRREGRWGRKRWDSRNAQIQSWQAYPAG